MADAPGPAALWQQAGGDGEKYRALLREHGLLLAPGDPGYEQGSRKLPCGWEPGKSRAGQDRCEVTDLLRDSCGHCTGAEQQQRDEERRIQRERQRSRGPWFSARYPGECADCGAEFDEDDQIRADGEGGWLCEECGDDG